MSSFESMLLEPVSNGYIVTIETEDGEITRHIFQTWARANKFMREVVKAHVDSQYTPDE